MSEKKPGKIIILNGSSSVGKTNISKNISDLAKTLYVRMGIDMVWGQLLPKKYIMFNEKSTEGMCLICDGNKISTKIGPKGQEVIDVFVKTIKEFQNRGINVVVDDVILTQEDLLKYSVLDCKNTYLFGLTCDSEELKKREMKRGDRPIGLVEGQKNLVHQYSKYYDKSFDTTDLFQVADKIDSVSKGILLFVETQDCSGIQKLKQDKLNF